MEKLSQEQLITYIKKQKLRIKQLETENEDLTKSKSSEQTEQTAIHSSDNDTQLPNISADYNLHIHNLQQELAQLKDAHESIKGDNIKYINQITELQTLNTTSTNEYNKLQIINENLSQSIQTLTQQVNTHETVSAELRDISGKYAQLSYEHEKLVEKYDTLNHISTLVISVRSFLLPQLISHH